MPYCKLSAQAETLSVNESVSDMDRINQASKSPVSLSVAATYRLPRWVLFAICWLYGFAGLFDRDPWKSHDASGLGVMWSMAQGSLDDWLMPNIAGRSFVHDGPLMFWLGAGMMRLFGKLLGGLHAARLVTALCFFLSCILLWRSAYLLGLRREMQPYPCVFGGQPQPRDYAQALADSALLIFLACLGAAPQLHESTAGMAQLSCVALLVYAMVLSLDQPRQGIGCCACALGGLVLASGPILSCALALAILISSLTCRGFRGLRLLAHAIPLGGLIAISWPALLLFCGEPGWLHLQAWIEQDFIRFSGPSAAALGYTMRNLLPYAWPAWPLVIWTLISWNKTRDQPHIVLPLSIIVGMLSLILLQRAGDHVLFMLLILPLALLASFSLPTLKRSVANVIDWFALMAATVLGGFIWLGWYAQFTGFPAWLARNLSRLLPGFSPSFDWISFLVALLASCAWLCLVYWRLTRAPKVIWRSVMLSAAGTSILWLLLMTLWRPHINYAKTYRDVAWAMASAIPSEQRDECIYSPSLGNPQLASFAYFTGLNFSDTDSRCRFILEQDTQQSTAKQSGQPQARHLLWTGHRPADRDERFRLYRRVVNP